ncbi:DUF6223 family protein [Nocardia camponoti]|uniref:Uncharacterized protein n=1 Tax=Nocardia camponoti TaxID=1616106 RepID=A0A917QA82_9NOCA|nr:DUF6223 family protein [Nocardia camponoti]GGK39000.1 hypothetical protein GCM10011591_08360 [Nocardia camponoti]
MRVATSAILASYATELHAAAEASRGRAPTTILALFTLTGIVTAILVLRDPTGRLATSPARWHAAIAGLIGLVGGAYLAATSPGGLGTGNGIAAAYFAIVLGAFSIGLGVLGMARVRRAT